MNTNASVVIIGGGIIGCSIACELLSNGITVTVVDRGVLLAEASTAAAGMLGAHVETYTQSPLFHLSKESQLIYREWIHKLEEWSGISAQYRSGGIVRTALTEEDESELKGRLPWIGSYSWLDANEIRKLEPAIGESVRGGLYFANDHQVHPRHLAIALREALLRLGCRIIEHTAVHSLLVNEINQVTGIQTESGDLYAETIILSSGAWSTELLTATGLDTHLLPIFPVKGECYTLHPPNPLFSKTIYTKGCYLVPRHDGTVTVGATQLEAGFDHTVSMSSLLELHKKATTLVPALASAEWLDSWAGLRPGTPDGLPYIGRIPDVHGLFAATGHYRNGILLAPITAKLLREQLMGLPLSLDLSPFAPGRFQSVLR